MPGRHAQAVHAGSSPDLFVCLQHRGARLQGPAQGQMLVMLDLPRARLEEITERVRSLHPLAMPHGADPDIPVFL